jgi:hypothetical protein
VRQEKSKVKRMLIIFFEIKGIVHTKGHYFDKIEVIEAESQAVLNTLAKHDFQDAFKNQKSAGNSAHE